MSTLSVFRRLLQVTAILFVAGLTGCASSGSRLAVGADTAPEEEAAILAVLDAFFIAMARRDTEAYGAVQTRDGMTYSQRRSGDGWTLRRRTNQDHLEALGAEEHEFLETYWSPTVLIRGPVAVVWAPYEFRVDGAVSHCGVDIFNMIKIDGRWVIGNAAWTVEPGACDELRPAAGVRIRPQELANR